MALSQTGSADAIAPLLGVVVADQEVQIVADRGRIDPDAAARGEALYAKKTCLICHGINLRSPGVPGPDLRESAIAANVGSLTAVLKNGGLEQHGMPRFAELSDDDIQSLYMYIRKGALDARRGVEGDAKVDRN